MALLDNTHYVDSAGYTAVTAWATGTVIAAGVLRRPTAAAAGNERVVICIVAGTTHATTEPTWATSRGAKNTDNTVTWQECTGLAGVNGDITNTPTWDQYKASTSAGTLGQLIKNNAGTHLFIMSTAGTIGASQPTFNTTTGNTTVDNGATWTCIGAVGAFTGNQAPHARMINALTANWGAAGNDIYIKSSHAATQSTNLSLAGASTLASPQRWLCHNGGAYPPAAANLTTGASETSSASALNISALNIYCEGIEFIGSNAGTTPNINTGNNGIQYYKNCKFTLSGSGAGQILTPHNTASRAGRTTFDNTTFSFSNVGQYLNFRIGTVIWKNTSSALLGGSVPTALIQTDAGGDSGNVTIDGVDLSAAGSGKTIVGADNFCGVITLTNCKLGGSVTFAGTPTAPGSEINFFNCNSGAINYYNERYTYRGTLTTETTIVRTGGASDGTTPISWKIVTTANASFASPFECFPISIWNETTGSSKTLTIECRGAAVPNDDEVWVEVEYLGASGNPGSSFVSDAKTTVLSAGAAQDSSSEIWGGSTASFKLAVTFTPQMKGFITARVRVAKASATFYVDPKITLS